MSARRSRTYSRDPLPPLVRRFPSGGGGGRGLGSTGPAGYLLLLGENDLRAGDSLQGSRTIGLGGGDDGGDGDGIDRHGYANYTDHLRDSPRSTTDIDLDIHPSEHSLKAGLRLSGEGEGGRPQYQALNRSGGNSGGPGTAGSPQGNQTPPVFKTYLTFKNPCCPNFRLPA